MKFEQQALNAKSETIRGTVEISALDSNLVRCSTVELQTRIAKQKK